MQKTAKAQFSVPLFFIGPHQKKPYRQFWEKAGVNHKMEFDEYIDAINRIPEKSPSVAEAVSTKRHSSINRLKLQYQIA